jgi:hypothetical protein
MQVAFCQNCGKHTGHKRSIGVGTALGALVTGGASLLAVPAYGKRCVICGLTTEQAWALRPATAPHDTSNVMPMTAEVQHWNSSQAQAERQAKQDTMVGYKWLGIILLFVLLIWGISSVLAR